MLKIGDKAPDFNLRDKEGKYFTLSSFNTDYKVVYFYPKDSTPGCTLEAKNFEDNLEKFIEINASVIGISGGDEESKRKFCEKNNLTLTLLSDDYFKTAKSYGVYGQKSFLGKKFFGISRTTFVLDSKNKVIKVFENVKPLKHGEEVLEYLNSRKEQSP